MARTKKDEAEFDANLRRENALYSDLVKTLRDEVAVLRVNQVVLFENLFRAEDALRKYREHHLEGSRRVAAMGRDVVGFRWEDSDGWHRADDAVGQR